MQGQLMLGLLVSVTFGAIGGNATGALFKKLSLGTPGNSSAGIVGGGIGGLSLGGALSQGGASWVGYVFGAILGSAVTILVIALVRPEK